MPQTYNERQALQAEFKRLGFSHGLYFLRFCRKLANGNGVPEEFSALWKEAVTNNAKVRLYTVRWPVYRG